MTGGGARPPSWRTAVGRRPAADPATAWVHRENPRVAEAKATVFTAPLTIDVTPALRGRIKVIALRRGLTVADMLRELLEDAYPEGAA